jgi:hypothetical protein
MAEMKPKHASAPLPKKSISAAAERARAPAERPAESGRSPALDPVRFGDWEVKGIATDF